MKKSLFLVVCITAFADPGVALGQSGSSRNWASESRGSSSSSSNDDDDDDDDDDDSSSSSSGRSSRRRSAPSSSGADYLSRYESGAKSSRTPPSWHRGPRTSTTPHRDLEKSSERTIRSEEASKRRAAPISPPQASSKRGHSKSSQRAFSPATPPPPSTGRRQEAPPPQEQARAKAPNPWAQESDTSGDRVVSKTVRGERNAPRATSGVDDYLDEIYPVSDRVSGQAKTPPRPSSPPPPEREARTKQRATEDRGRRSGHRGFIANNGPSITVETEDLLFLRRDSLGLRPRFGASYAAMADCAMWNLGFGLSYTFHPRIMLDIRGDFQMPVVGVDNGPLLSEAWISLNLIYYFLTHSIIQPYVIAGVALVVAPGDESLGIESVVAGGGQAGVGVEILLLNQRLGVSFEAIGMISGYDGQVLEGGATFTTAVSVYL